MDIAVLVDKEGRTTGFEKDGLVQIYTKKDDIWSVKKEMEHQSENLRDAEAFRKSLKSIGLWMQDCKIMVVKRIRGVQYLAFEELQISMLQIAGYPQDFLNDIRECEHHERVEQEISLEHVAIFEQNPGYFYSDLRDVMNGKTSYNSKQILLPFLKKGAFEGLELLCDHVPKWFDKELPALNLIFFTEQFKNCVKVKIHPLKKI